MLVRRIARPLLASIFVVSGADAVQNPAGRAGVATPFFDSALGRLPVVVDAETLVRVNGAVQTAAGVALAAGVLPRAAAAVLAGSLVPTTLAGHAFWQATDPATRSAQQVNFLKNLSIFGGLLYVAGTGTRSTGRG